MDNSLLLCKSPTVLFFNPLLLSKYLNYHRLDAATDQFFPVSIVSHNSPSALKELSSFYMVRPALTVVTVCISSPKYTLQLLPVFVLVFIAWAELELVLGL